MPGCGKSVTESIIQRSGPVVVPGLGQELPDALDPAGTFLLLLQAWRPLKLHLHVALQDRNLQWFGQLPIRREQTHQPVLEMLPQGLEVKVLPLG